MKWLVLILLGVSLISFAGAGDSSETQTDFNIRGCTFNFEGELIGVVAGECSKGDADGQFYCDEDRYPWVTTEAGLGCSLGKNSYTLGDAFCCPSGMFCNETGEGEFKCDRRTENCFDMTTKSDCESVGCVWFDDKCVDGVRDYGCEIYDNEIDCETDVWNLGQVGVGTGLCGEFIECNDGTVYSISEENCSCAWHDYAPEGKKCQVELVGVQTFYGPDETQDIFSCSNVYDLGECIDGKQDVIWYSTSSVMQGFDTLGGIIPEDCLDALGCNDGKTTRGCGEPIIKLSGFSLFAIFVSLFIIGIYYFCSDNRKI